MTPGRFAEVEADRVALARCAGRHGWAVQLPHHGPGWVFMLAYHQQTGWRITVEWSDDLPGGCVLHLLNVRSQHTSHVDYATPQDVRLAITDTDMLDTLARMSVEHYAGLIDLTRIDLTGEVA